MSQAVFASKFTHSENPLASVARYNQLEVSRWRGQVGQMEPRAGWRLFLDVSARS